MFTLALFIMLAAWYALSSPDHRSPVSRLENPPMHTPNPWPSFLPLFDPQGEQEHASHYSQRIALRLAARPEDSWLFDDAELDRAAHACTLWYAPGTPDVALRLARATEALCRSLLRSREAYAAAMREVLKDEVLPAASMRAPLPDHPSGPAAGAGGSRVPTPPRPSAPPPPPQAAPPPAPPASRPVPASTLSTSAPADYPTAAPAPAPAFDF